MKNVKLAKQIMEKAHVGQTRWDGRPYSIHPVKVVEILQDFGVKDEDILIAGYLHDVLEDTGYPELQIKQKFGSRVLSLVQELTYQEGDDEYYWLQTKILSKDAKIIKLADILANLGDEGKKSTHFIQKRVTALRIIMRGLNIS